MAEREGFEPSIPVSRNTRLAGERLRPNSAISPHLLFYLIGEILTMKNGVEFPQFPEDTVVHERNLRKKWGTHQGVQEGKAAPTECF